MTGIRVETRDVRARRTMAWRRKNSVDAFRNAAHEPGESGLLALRVCRDFAGIMCGYSDEGEASYSLDRFMDSLFHNTHWR